MPVKIGLNPRTLGTIVELTSKAVAQKHLKIAGYEAKQFAADTPMFLGTYSLPTSIGLVSATVGLKMDAFLLDYLDELHGFSVSKLALATNLHHMLGTFFSKSVGAPLRVHVMPPVLGDVFQHGFSLSIQTEEGLLEWVFFDGFAINLNGGQF